MHENYPNLNVMNVMNTQSAGLAEPSAIERSHRVFGEVHGLNERIQGIVGRIVGHRPPTPEPAGSPALKGVPLGLLGELEEAATTASSAISAIHTALDRLDKAM